MVWAEMNGRWRSHRRGKWWRVGGSVPQGGGDSPEVDEKMAGEGGKGMIGMGGPWRGGVVNWRRGWRHDAPEAAAAAA